jgi:hypothetical protein
VLIHVAETSLWNNQRARGPADLPSELLSAAC